MNLTRWIIIGIIAVTIIIDVGLALIYGKDATISVQITKWSVYPSIPFAFGFLMGHFFAQDKE